ncbi:MAG: hypothetical protein OXC72_15080 [Roseovarius sp.]|nr:hypothetical protein [Roseovarius sp.]
MSWLSLTASAQRPRIARRRVRLAPSPPRSPKPNPNDGAFRFTKSDRFANRVRETAEEVKEHVAKVRNGFAEMPERV